jgi:hypothetical protein
MNSTSPPFQLDSACPTALIAAQKEGCVGPFSNFSNSYMDIIFTSHFGVVGRSPFSPLECILSVMLTFTGVHAILILCVAMVLKDRKERARYKLIDAKNGFRPI